MRKSKNYYSMNLQSLGNELRGRNLGDGHLYNELNKFYGVTRPPQQQVDARDEAIRRLIESDKRKISIGKIAVITGGAVGFLAGIATIISFLTG